MKQEQPPIPEQDHEENQWVRMRLGLNSSNRNEVDRVSWEGIAYDKHLLINPEHIAKQLSLLHIPFDIHIRSFSNSNRNRDVPSGQISSDGTITPTVASSKNKEKKQHLKCYFDDEHNYFIISFDSTDIAESVQNSLVDGIRSPHFFEEYGKKINENIEAGLVWAFLRAVVTDLGSEDVNYTIELIGAFGGAIGEIVFIILTLASFLLKKESNTEFISTILIEFVLSYMAFYAEIYYLLSIAVYFADYSEKKDTKLKTIASNLKRLYDFLSKNGVTTLLFPTTAFQRVLLPYLAYKTNRKEYIKGK